MLSSSWRGGKREDTISRRFLKFCFALLRRTFPSRLQIPHPHFPEHKCLARTGRREGCDTAADCLTLRVSGLVFRLPLSSGCSRATGKTGWVNRSRLCLLYCRAQSQTEGSGGSLASEGESG